MMASAFESPSSSDARFLSSRADENMMYETRITRVAVHLEQCPCVCVVPIRRFEDVVASQNRVNAIRADFRGELEGLICEELTRLPLLGRSIAHVVYASMRTEQARRAS